MTTTILCTDGSEIATRALEAGVRVLAPADRVLLVTVLEPLDATLVTGVSGFGTGVLSPQQFADADDARRVAADEILRGAVVHLGVTDVETVIIDGEPGRSLCELAGEVEATTIVIGTRGRGGVRRAVLGSVSDHVVRNAPCSVLVTT